MSTPKVVVTGAGGFLGRALTRRLANAGASVRAVTRSARLDIAGVQCLPADVLDEKALAQVFCGADAVFHLVAHVHDVSSRDDTEQQRMITLGSALSMLRAAEEAGVRSVIFASSLAVFGNVKGAN